MHTVGDVKLTEPPGCMAPLVLNTVLSTRPDLGCYGTVGESAADCVDGKGCAEMIDANDVIRRPDTRFPLVGRLFSDKAAEAK